MTARAAFLRALPRHAFAPPEADVAALGALPGADAAARFEDEVRRFAGEFWTLNPTERTTRWRSLATRAVGGAAVWLQELAPGLRVVPLGHFDPGAAELAGVVRRLFVLRPRVRADCRLRWLADEAERFPELVRGARALLRDDMPLARLEPRLFDWLAAGTAPRPLAPRGELGQPERLSRLWARVKDLRTAQVVGVVLGVVGAVALVGFMVGGGRPAPPPPVIPPAPLPAPVPPLVPFHEEEVSLFLDYERRPFGRPAPARYDAWLAAGRPAGVRTP